MKTIAEQLRDLVEELVQGTDLFLIDLKVKPSNEIQVFIDGDNGVTIDAVSKLNKALYQKIDEAVLFDDGDFALEVSSAGVGSPLKLYRQYRKNLGRTLEVTMQDNSVLTGKMLEANEDFILLEVADKKKKETTEYKIALTNIQKAIVQVSFK